MYNNIKNHTGGNKLEAADIKKSNKKKKRFFFKYTERMYLFL